MVVKQWYDAQEAIQKLGVSKTKFYDYVKEGRIHKELDPNRQRGARYPAHEVDNLAAALRGIEIVYNPEELQERTFRVARPEDAPAVSQFSSYIFEQSGGYGLPVEVFAEWFKLPYLEIGHVLLEKGQVKGYTTVLPLHHEQVLQIMHKEVRPSKIPVKELALLEPGKPIDLFVGDVAVEPSDKHAAAYLIGKMLNYFQDLGKQGIEVEGIYATASTREGINICRRAGMRQMEVPDVQPNWIPFELKIQEANNSFAKSYLRNLNIYKRKRERTKR